MNEHDLSALEWKYTKWCLKWCLVIFTIVRAFLGDFSPVIGATIGMTAAKIHNHERGQNNLTTSYLDV